MRVLPISERLLDKAGEITEQLKAAGIRAELDTRNEKMGYKIRQAQIDKIPYMLIIGDKEAEEGVVSVRHRKEGDLGTMTLADFTSRALTEIATKSKN